MADNIAATPGSGATLAAKDIGGVLYPKSILYDADGNEVMGQQDAAAWNLSDASSTLIAIEKAAALELEAIKNAVTNTTAVSLTKKLSENSRTDVTFGVYNFATTATADTVIGSGWVFTVDGGAVDTGTGANYIVPTGKRLRVVSIVGVLTFPSGHTTAGGAIVTLRAATSGSISTSSPRQLLTAASYGTVAYSVIALPVPSLGGDGWEFPADTRIGASVELNVTWNTTTNAPRVSLTFIGHLYDDTP